jgi:hypothetical protein
MDDYARELEADKVGFMQTLIGLPRSPESANFTGSLWTTALAEAIKEFNADDHVAVSFRTAPSALQTNTRSDSRTEGRVGPCETE